MRPFEFARPTDLAQALAAAQDPRSSRPIAGGTELVNLMREGIYSPDRVIDINGLSELGRVDVNATHLVIGALARMSDVAAHEVVVREFPAISQALLESASPQIRNMATLGGNLMQRTRCIYFRNGDIDAPCNKRKVGSGCAALTEGRPRDFALFGWSDRCIATHPSDVAVALVAFDASVRLRSSGGERVLPVLDFLRLPGAEPERDTALRSDELILAIEVPSAPLTHQSVFLKLRDRASYEFALLSAAAAVVIEGGRIVMARLALGGLAPRPWRLAAAEQALRGVAPDSPELPAIIAADLTSIPARPGTDVKLRLAQRLAVRAICAAANRPDKGHQQGVP